MGATCAWSHFALKPSNVILQAPEGYKPPHTAGDALDEGLSMAAEAFATTEFAQGSVPAVTAVAPSAYDLGSPNTGPRLPTGYNMAAFEQSMDRAHHALSRILVDPD